MPKILPTFLSPSTVIPRAIAIFGAFFLTLAALAPMPANAQIPADLQDYSEIAPGPPSPVDGIWRLQELNRRVMIESGHVIAMDEWIHALLWQVSSGMVTSTDIRQTGDGKFTAYDALLKRPMNWTLREDGSIEARGEGGWFPPVFHFLPIELNYPEAFEEEIAIAAGGAAMTLPPASPDALANTQPERPGPIAMDPEWTGRFHFSDTVCLDLNGPDDITQGGKIQLWECNDQIHQQFVFLEEDGLIVSGTGMCLEASAASNGAQVLSYGCDGNDAQVWSLEPAPSSRKKRSLLVAHRLRHSSGLCLDAQGWSDQRNGTGVHLWECNSSASQEWTMP